jgi:error-prone DNA polymerase
VHYPAAFYTALLNNQPMGFYHPATLVKDAQRRGVRFHPIDVQQSAWNCTVERDGAIRLGLRYVSGLRQEVGKKVESAEGPLRERAAMESHAPAGSRQADRVTPCPKCGCDDPTMLERVDERRSFCNNCSHDWTPRHRPARFASIDDLVARAGLRRDELVTLAEIGALNAFGYDRRSALWQAERAIRPSGELFTTPNAAGAEAARAGSSHPGSTLTAPDAASDSRAANAGANLETVVPDRAEAECPLKPMNEAERLVADYAGMGLTAGRHPMALHREDLAMRGVLRAIDLHRARQGRRVRVAGMVITRQRPGTAKGFVFLTLEDETGIANIIVRPDLFVRDRLVIVEEPFLIIDGVLQNQDGVTSVRADEVHGMRGVGVDFDAHDFY